MAAVDNRVNFCCLEDDSQDVCGHHAFSCVSVLGSIAGVTKLKLYLVNENEIDSIFVGEL